MLCSFYNQPEVVGLLSKSGAKVLAVDEAGNEEVVSQLVNAGADISITNRSNKTPIDIADGEAAEFLEELQLQQQQACGQNRSLT